MRTYECICAHEPVQVHIHVYVSAYLDDDDVDDGDDDDDDDVDVETCGPTHFCIKTLLTVTSLKRP